MDQVGTKLRVLVADCKVLHSKLMLYQWNANELSLYELEVIIRDLAASFSRLGDELIEQILERGEMPLVTMKECFSAARISDEKCAKFNINSMISTLMDDLNYFYYQLKELQMMTETAPLIAKQCKVIQNNLAWLECSVDYSMQIPTNRQRVVDI